MTLNRARLLYVTVAAVAFSALLGVISLLVGHLGAVVGRALAIGLSAAWFGFLGSRAAALNGTARPGERWFGRLSTTVCLLALCAWVLALLFSWHHAVNTPTAPPLWRLAYVFGPLAFALALSCEQLVRRETLTDPLVNGIAYAFAAVSSLGALVFCIPVLFIGRFPHHPSLYVRCIVSLILLGLALLVIGPLVGRARRPQ